MPIQISLNSTLYNRFKRAVKISFSSRAYVYFFFFFMTIHTPLWAQISADTHTQHENQCSRVEIQEKEERTSLFYADQILYTHIHEHFRLVAADQMNWVWLYNMRLCVTYGLETHDSIFKRYLIIKFWIMIMCKGLNEILHDVDSKDS